ncbi:MAG: hypothetical protein ABIQ11_01910 [Saprospiraceae bacterium]
MDENQWMSGEDILGRKRILFTEKNGVYWGPPASDNAAIKEMESDREKGAGYIVFTWPAFWWLEHYRDFTKYLDTMYDCIVQNERMTIYDLRNQNSTS